MNPSNDKKIYVFYRPSDFILYLYSLAIIGGAFWLAYPYDWVRAALAAGLLYMAVTFLLKRGATFDVESFSLIVRGTLSYPWELARRFWRMRVRAPILFAFAVAVGIELALRQRLDPDSFWLHPFPYATCAAIAFLGVSLYRTAIFVAHLSRASIIRSVLETSSSWRHELKRLSTWNHILHAYLTGLLSNAGCLVPMMIFWRYTHPTYVRETVMFTLLIAMLCKSAVRYLRAHVIGFSAHNMAVAMQIAFSTGNPHLIDATWERHDQNHRSRFRFAIFHGHHHDAIPSGVMATIDAGFAEGIDRHIYMWTFLDSIVITLIFHAISVCYNMILHQYIPGIYPYSKAVVARQAHHVAHHYGSLLPLGGNGVPSYKLDIEHGYDPDNVKVRWYLDTVRKYEPLDDTSYDRFVHLDIDARIRDDIYSPFADTRRVRIKRQ